MYQANDKRDSMIVLTMKWIPFDRSKSEVRTGWHPRTLQRTAYDRGECYIRKEAVAKVNRIKDKQVPLSLPFLAKYEYKTCTKNTRKILDLDRGYLIKKRRTVIEISDKIEEDVAGISSEDTSFRPRTTAKDNNFVVVIVTNNRWQ
jgi:hypothetical protein